MSESNHCPQCGCDLSADSPGGLCPNCLLNVGPLASDLKAADPPATQGRPAHGFVPPKPEDLADRFPQYEILDLLGQGGMGAVYRARQKSLDRLVALKIIKPDAAGDQGFAERFTREAKALARLNHSAIVSVHDFGESDGLYFFVMEHVDGTNLRRLLETKELSPEQAMQIIPQVCEALQIAHDEGIVHRDIKPENILIDSKGRVKIADFGLAKLLGQTSHYDQTLTGTHQVMGTPRYMAPEQMEGSRTVDHRADIYSLGVVFYEMLTGELPLGSFEPPSRKVQIDVRLDEIVLRSLAKEPARRYQHASDVKTDVESIFRGRQVRPPAAIAGGHTAGRIDSAASALQTEESEDGMATLILAGLFFGSVVGFALMFMPWAQVEIETLPEGTSQRGLVAEARHRLEAEGHAFSLPILGGMLSLVLFVFALVKTVIGQFPSPSRAMLAAATGLTLLLTGGLILGLGPVPNLPEDYSGVLRQIGHSFTDSEYALRELQILARDGSIRMQVESDEPGRFFSIAFGVVLLVASLFEMRAVLAPQLTESAGDVSALLSGPATALRWTAWSSPLLIPVLLVINLSYSMGRPSPSVSLIVVLFLQIAHALLLVPLIVIGLARMQSSLSWWLAVAVSVLSMLPLGVSFLVGLPAGIWSLVVLAQPEVMGSFRGPTLKRDVVARQLRRAGIGLFVTSLIGLLFWLAMVGASLLVLTLQIQRGDDIDMDPVAFWLLLLAHPLPVVLSACQALAAWRMLKLESYTWALAATVIALIPISPAWLVGLPLGVWSLAMLLDKEARNLFAASKTSIKNFLGLGIGYGSATAGREEEEQEQERDPALTRLQTGAGFVTMAGALRCWRLISDSYWSNMFDSFGLTTIDGSGDLVLGLTGPVILVAAIMMYHARMYWLAVVGCALCLLSASVPALIIGGWALVTLFDPKVRQRFSGQSKVQ